jgi:hypothetical protein
VKIIVCILPILFTLASCNFFHEKKQEKTLYYYRNSTSNGEFKSKKFEKEQIERHDKLDILVGKASFIFEHKRHEVRVYTNSTHCAIDAARLAYELDNFGIIYSKSTNFKAYSVLKSNNHGINQILERAIDFIIFHPDLNISRAILQPK